MLAMEEKDQEALHVPSFLTGVTLFVSRQSTDSGISTSAVSAVASSEVGVSML